MFLSKYISATKVFPLLFFITMPFGFEGVAHSLLVCASCCSVIQLFLYDQFRFISLPYTSHFNWILV